MRYLSDEWFEAMSEAIAQAGPAPSGPLTIDQRVDDIGTWRVQLGDEPALVVDPSGDADAVFSQSLETARAVASGTTDAHQAFLLGEVRFEGDIERLIAHRDSLAWLAQVTAPVMAATNWDS